MYARVDEVPPLQQIGHRFVNNRHRYYYTHKQVHDLLVVCMDLAIEYYQDHAVVLKFSNKEDSALLCDDLPNAPQEWRGTVVRKATIMPIIARIKSEIHPINEVLF